MKKKLLIVDDKDTIAKVGSFYLSDEFDIDYKSDAGYALDYIKEGNIPDIIVLDIRMPRMKVDELLRILKAASNYKSILILMLSSEDSTSVIFRLLYEGAEDYIWTPFTPMTFSVSI